MWKERFILFPGLGADGRMFDAQRAGDLDFETPRLPVPDSKDDLPAYAARVHEMLKLNDPCVLGGTSFGGMLACELASLCPCQCVILIASCRGRSAIPAFYSFIEFISRAIPDFLICNRRKDAAPIIARLAGLEAEHHMLFHEITCDAPIELLRRGGRMIMNWTNPTAIPCPVYHIHGDRDWVIPFRRLQPPPAELVTGGGHLINITHAAQVNRFIRRYLNKPVDQLHYEAGAR